MHRNFFTNVKLHKVGIKSSPLCSFGEIHDDSIEYMLFPKIQSFWDSVCDCLVKTGNSGYIISVERVILGDLENIDLFSHIILTCKVIYNVNAMKSAITIYYVERYLITCSTKSQM